MMTVAKILPLAARVEAQRRRSRSIPANDNDPQGPPPAAASHFSLCSKMRGRKCSTTISRFLKGDETITAIKSIALPDLKAAWSHVTEIAKTINEPGSRIRVTNPAGGVEILAGVSIARCDFADALAA